MCVCVFGGGEGAIVQRRKTFTQQQKMPLLSLLRPSTIAGESHAGGRH